MSFQVIPVYSRSFQVISGHSRLFLVIPGYSRSFKASPVHSRLFQVILGYVGFFQAIPGYSRSFHVIPGHSRLLQMLHCSKKVTKCSDTAAHSERSGEQPRDNQLSSLLPHANQFHKVILFSACYVFLYFSWRTYDLATVEIQSAKVKTFLWS
jgi:hypothetical protein